MATGFLGTQNISHGDASEEALNAISVGDTMLDANGVTRVVRAIVTTVANPIDLFVVTPSSGDVFTCSGDTKVLSNGQYKKVKELKAGDVLGASGSAVYVDTININKAQSTTLLTVISDDEASATPSAVIDGQKVALPKMADVL